MKYIPKLDGLRFVAILIVLLSHFVHFIFGNISGQYGVNLFFVLSGFLITSILLAQKEGPFIKNYGIFMGKRILRIFPLYYLIVFFLYTLHAPNINSRVISLLTFTYNYPWAAANYPHDSFGAFWSLCVEEQFYIFFPLVVLLTKKYPRLLLGLLSGILIVAYAQIFFHLFHNRQYNYAALSTNMAPLCLGALGAVFKKSNQVHKVYFLQNKAVEIMAILLIAFSLVLGNWEMMMLVGSVCNLFFIVKIAVGEIKLKFIEALLGNKRIIYLGRISYGIYVFHLLIAFYFGTFIDPLWEKIPFQTFGVFSRFQFHKWLIELPLYSAITCLVAHISFNYFESPILRLKKLLEPRQKPLGVSPSPPVGKT